MSLVWKRLRGRFEPVETHTVVFPVLPSLMIALSGIQKGERSTQSVSLPGSAPLRLCFCVFMCALSGLCSSCCPSVDKTGSPSSDSHPAHLGGLHLFSISVPSKGVLWKWSEGVKASEVKAGSPPESMVLPHSAGPHQSHLFQKPKGETAAPWALWQQHHTWRLKLLFPILRDSLFCSPWMQLNLSSSHTCLGFLLSLPAEDQPMSATVQAVLEGYLAATAMFQQVMYTPEQVWMDQDIAASPISTSQGCVCSRSLRSATRSRSCHQSFILSPSLTRSP